MFFSTPKSPFSNVNSFGQRHVRQGLAALAKRRGRDDRLTAAQAKRDRKNAKRAEIAARG
jgi:hypothetical protein